MTMLPEIFITRYINDYVTRNLYLNSNTLHIDGHDALLQHFKLDDSIDSITIVVYESKASLCL